MTGFIALTAINGGRIRIRKRAIRFYCLCLDKPATTVGITGKDYWLMQEMPEFLDVALL